jgi:GNAT superfamily N-acetyltransferase
MPDPAIRIRKAEMRDAEAVRACVCALAAETGTGSIDAVTALLGVKAVLKDAHKGFYLLAESTNQRGLAGLLRVSFAWDDRSNRNFWWLAGIWVTPAWRGRKVCSALFRHLTDLARFHKDVAGLKLQLARHRGDCAPIVTALGFQQAPDDLFEILFGD